MEVEPSKIEITPEAFFKEAHESQKRYSSAPAATFENRTEWVSRKYLPDSLRAQVSSNGKTFDVLLKPNGCFEVFLHLE